MSDIVKWVRRLLGARGGALLPPVIGAPKPARPALPYDDPPSTDRPVFYVRRGDRLVARLKHMLYACRFARQVEGVVGIVWPDPPASWARFDGPNYHPALIFDLDRFRAAGGGEWLRFLPGTTPFQKGGLSVRDEAYSPYRPRRFERGLFAEPGLVFYEPHLLHWRFVGERPDRASVESEIRSIFAELPLSVEVLEGVERVRAALHGVDYACIHFRAGDVFATLSEALPAMVGGTLPAERLTLLMEHYVGRTSPIELFDPQVARLVDEGRTLLFSSDSPQFIHDFKQRYGAARIVDLAVFEAGEPIQKAMVDFCALGGGREILGSRGNYGSLAAALGGAKLTIVSAATETALSPAAVIELYHAQAVERLFGGVTPPPAVDAAFRAAMIRLYTFQNRLGDKATIAALDPRPGRR